MAEKKRKSREETARTPARTHQFKSKTLTTKSKRAGRRGGGGEGRKRRRGPGLPNSLRKELQLVNSKQINSDDDDGINSDQEKDVYEYEEDLPQEESRKNRRFDPVENFEYELPENFEDENVSSSDDDVVDGHRQADSDGEDEFNGGVGDDEEEGEDKGRHSRMLQGITGLPSEAFEGRSKKSDIVITEAYPESEYNPTRDVLDGGGLLSIQDLLNPLHGKPGFSQLRKRILQVEKKSESVRAPLPMVDREKIERKVAYEQTKKDITKWEPLVKRNREAPTLYFDEDTNLGFSTVGSIASEFKPRTEFEKKMAALVHHEMLMDAHKNDGQRLLELNTISVEDVKERESRLAKMRFMMFRHELKAKRVKKIKSKTYHRLNKKDKLKASSSELHMDPEAAKELAIKQEFKRAEERMTMKHKNTSKWAKRNIKRGLSIQDEGTRAAMSEQLHQHALLTRKMNSMKDNSSSDESSDEDEESGSDQDVPSKLLAKAKEKTLEVLEDDDEVPNSGVFSLPFMVRGLKKREDAANEEAKLALQEYESLSRQLEDADADTAEKSEATVPSGRRVFGATQKQGPKSTKRTRSDVMGNMSDSEDDLKVEETFDSVRDDTQKEDTVFRHEESETGQPPVFEGFTDIFNKPQTKTAYDVAIFAPDGPKKKSRKVEVDKKSKTSQKMRPRVSDQDQEDESSGMESEGQMVDGILSSGTEASYELPNLECIKLAFAGDNVEDDFAKSKEKLLSEEVPEPEKPSITPGWGDWASKQKKGRGCVPRAMLKEYEDAKKMQEEKLKHRKDANLKHVIISERLDKKTAKLHTKTLPFPYTSNEVFEQSNRMPIGPEFNPTSAIGDLNRPEVVKTPGVIIKPIQFEDVNPYEKDDENKHNKEKHKNNRKRKQKRQGETSKTSSVKPRKMR